MPPNFYRIFTTLNQPFYPRPVSFLLIRSLEKINRVQENQKKASRESFLEERVQMVSSIKIQVAAKQTTLATNNLRHEHEAALRVLNLMDRAAAYLREGRRISPFFFEEVVDFLQL